MTISLSFKFHKNPTFLKLSRTILKNDDTLLEFRRTWRFLDWGWGPWSRFWYVSLMMISLSFKFIKNLSCLRLSKTLLKNDDTQLEFRRSWRFLTGTGVLGHVFWCVHLMTLSLNFKFHKNLSCLKPSRTLLKNDDTQLEFRRSWRFLTGVGVLDHVFDVFVWWQLA